MRGIIEEKLRPIAMYLENGIDIVRAMGITVLEMRRGYVRLMAPLKGNGNHFGSMYAGVIFSLADIAGGALFVSTFDYTRFIPIVREVDIRFLKPVAEDLFVEASIPEETIARIERELDENGRAEWALDLSLRYAGGATLDTVRGVFQGRKIPAGIALPVQPVPEGSDEDAHG